MDRPLRCSGRREVDAGGYDRSSPVGLPPPGLVSEEDRAGTERVAEYRPEDPADEQDGLQLRAPAVGGR